MVERDNEAIRKGAPYLLFAENFPAKAPSIEMEQHRITRIWGESPVWGAPLIKYARYDAE